MLTTRAASVRTRLRLATASSSSLRCFASSSSPSWHRFPSRPLLARAPFPVLSTSSGVSPSRQQQRRPISTSAERTWRPPPVELGRPIESYFGVNVFDRNKLRASISSEAFISYMNSIQTDTPIEAGVADAIATSLLAWAKERGATHYTHWFQPLTGGTAEKHDTFLDPRPDGAPLTRFRGKELITGEPDGSSFPTGGLRATHGARGYTCWDPQSPPFILNNGHTNGGTLYIPSLFYSWKDGHALDDKTPLLRANQALQAQALEVFRALGDTETTSVHADAGLEQEFFLIKREYFLKRTDLLLTGRTLLGAAPPKGQEMEDQYFGHPPEAAIDAIHEFEIEMWKLGVPLMTRHREVAPGQYEIAPKFAPSNIACDRNLIMMEMLKKVARRHGLAALIHEKPFTGVNGSGKHNNWSLGTNKIPTLYQPSDNPHTDIYFMLFLGATMRALDKHSDLMRVAISSAGNDHRLGAHEAPPAIVSAYLGDDINESVEKFIRGDKTPSSLNLNVNLGVGTLPRLKRVATDRNRTSAFAFTSNKFEFRAVGAPQNPSRSCMVISTIMADSLRDVAAELKKLKAQGKSNDQSVEAVARKLLSDHKRVIFNGNNYSPEWIKEAEKRGLHNLRTTPAALKLFNSPKNVELFKSLGVLKPDEVTARASVMYEEYVKRILIEAKTVTSMASTQVVPAATTAQTELAGSILAGQSVSTGSDFTQQKKQLASLTANIETLLKETDRVKELIHNAHSQGSEVKSAEFCEKQIIPAMKAVREAADAIERIVPAKTWPMPTYHDILFHQD